MKKIAAKFIEDMRECAHVSKDGENGFHHYRYATSAAILEKVNAALVKQGIATAAMTELVNMTDVTTTKGSIEHLATVKTTITLIDKDSDEMMTISGIGGGQDSGDKAVMKAQTAAIKYAFMLSLAISTGDDPEADKTTDENSIMDAAMKAKAAVTASRTRKPAGVKKRDGDAAVMSGMCSDCGAPITGKVEQFSMSRYGRPLCFSCQQMQGAA